VSRIAPAELRTLFLFERLDEPQLDWLAEHADVVEVAAGRTPGAGRGRLVGVDPVEILRADQRRVYAGAVQFYLGDHVDQTYRATVQATSESTFLTLRAREFMTAFRAWYPLAVQLL
jgi:hypothetical protein